MKKTLLLAFLLFAAFALGQTRAKSLYKISHLSATDFSITCLNGADPTGVKVGNLLIISCGR